MWFTGPQMSNTLEAQVAEDDNNVNDSDAVCSMTQIVISLFVMKRTMHSFNFYM